VALLDPMSGRAGMARTRQGADGAVEVYLHIEPGQSVLLRTFDSAVEGQPWRYLETTDESFAIGGRWQVEFIAGGPTLPGAFSSESLTSWTDRGADAESFAGTAKYATTFDAPAAGGDYLLDLGRVAESARVRLNGVDLGVVFARPFTVPVPTGALRSTGNVLEVDVTNLSANRIRDLDRRGVEWRIFHDINFVNI